MNTKIFFHLLYSHKKRCLEAPFLNSVTGDLLYYVMALRRKILHIVIKHV